MDAAITGGAHWALVFAARALTVATQYFCMCKLLPNRISRPLLAALSLVYALWFTVLNQELLGTAYHLWMNLFINALTYGVVLFLFRGKLWRKLMVWCYFDTIKTMCEVVAYAPLLLLGADPSFGDSWAWNPSSARGPGLRLLYMVMFFAVFMLLCGLSLAIWRKLLIRRFEPFYLLFITLPMGLKYALTRVFHPGMGDWFLALLIKLSLDMETCYHILSLFGIGLSLVSGVAFFYYMVSYDRRASVAAELRELQRVMEREQARYREIEARSEAFAKIRHDFNNQLASVRQMVQLGEAASAKELVQALSSEIERKRP